MNFDPRRHALPLAGLWWVLLMTCVVALRPLTPVDETRYATVAWEMWQTGDWLSLRMNGAPYGDKPPLLFWLVNLGWWVFGPNEWWPRLMTGLFALGALALVVTLVRRLAPGRDDLAAMSVLVSGSSLYWMGFTGALMFDLMLTFFVLLGVLGVAWAGAGGGLRAWLLTGLAMGLGILTKGPVALLHVLPLALLAPWWRRGAGGPADAAGARWGAWYGGIALAVLVAAAVALAWALPAAMAGGEAYRREIFWNQSADRIATTNHHLRPFWFYAAMLPVLLLPWLFLPAAWRGISALARSGPSPGVRFALAWLVPVFLAFSAFRGKQVQYLLPEVPAIAFLLASGVMAAGGRLRRLDAWTVAGLYAVLAVLPLVLARHPRGMHLLPPEEWPILGWTVAACLAAALVVAATPWRDAVRALAVIGSASVLATAGMVAGFGRVAFDIYDLHPVSRHLAAVQQAGQAIAHAGKYHGQFQFMGRLTQPLQAIDGRGPLLEWASAHPEGRVVLYSAAPLTHAAGARPEFAQKFKGGWVSVWRAADLPGVSDGWYRQPGDAE
jgi:4-amino-4-deoxy-L-arabinose transferase-like glycosyltransferase